MSFFSEEGDDSNLQYDDAAFLYFIASTLIVGAIVTVGFLIRDLLKLRIQDKDKLIKAGIFERQLANLKADKVKKVFNSAFFIKIGVLCVLIALTFFVYEYSIKAENKLQGFDPFEILGVPKDASLRDIKKAYRKLALEFHPDKNIGNPAAQAKFILISKSYECFTNEEKKANCFKFGNPDGSNAFRVGIGLPALFIKAEYKYYILPIVLSIFLLIVPAFMLKWNNRTRALDPYGVEIASYDTLFQCLHTDLSAINVIYMLASFKQIYIDCGCGPISPQNKQKLFTSMEKHPNHRWPLLQTMSDYQLNIFWEIYKYVCGYEELSYPGIRDKIEEILLKIPFLMLPFTQKAMHNQILYGNPNWKIIYLGTKSIEFLVLFQRAYLNRSLVSDVSNSASWQFAIDFNEEQKEIVSKKPIQNIYLTLKNNTISEYLKNFSENRRGILEKQFKNIPIYHLETKIKVGTKDSKEITNYDHAQIYYKISKLNPTSGYGSMNKYPFPKKENLYVVFTSGGDEALYFNEIDINSHNGVYINKFAYKQPTPGHYKYSAYVLSDGYYGIDVFTSLQFNVIDAPEELKNKKVLFHKEDLHLERHKKNFFEELMDLQIDPEEGMLSDSDEDEEEEVEKK